VSELSLLNPEWQGCGAADAAVCRGAVAIAAGLFPEAGFVRVEVPVEEALTSRDQVLGLASIAPRFRRTVDALRWRAPDRIFHIGGTCGTELAPVGYLNERHAGGLAVVWLDAHGDLNTPATSPSGRFHGMVLRTLLGAGPAPLVTGLQRQLRPGQIFLAGTRDLDLPEAEFVTSAGISLTTVAELADPSVLVERIRAAGLQELYVHLDLDVLDPIEFPDSLVPTPQGLALPTAAAAIRALTEAFDVVGFSVVEFCPRTSDGLVKLSGLLHDCGVTVGAMRQLKT
jgi:arginase